MRCQVTVKSLENFEKAVDRLLKQYDGMVLQLKPKLDTPLMNVTIHVIHYERLDLGIKGALAGEI